MVACTKGALIMKIQTIDNPTDEATKLLTGSIDMHVHSLPDLANRPIDIIELAKQAKSAAMRGLVLKNTHCMTTFLASIVNKIVEDFEVYGSIVLEPSVGGFNSYAVDTTIKSGGKVVWMPTSSSNHNIEYLSDPERAARFSKTKASHDRTVSLENSLSPFAKNGEILPSVKSILHMIAESDTVLASGHLSLKESKILFEEAKDLGVKKFVFTHANYEVTLIPIQDQIELAKQGAYIEHAVLPLMPSYNTMSLNELAEIITKVGAKQIVLVTDFGQKNNPSPVEGMRIIIQMLLDEGISNKEIATMVQENPRKLLNIEK